VRLPTGWWAQLPEPAVQLGLPGPELGTAGLIGPGELSGRALALGLCVIQLVLEIANALVGLEKLVHVKVNALGAGRLPDGVRMVSDESPVEHECASALA
jgi:hypothetical protein